MGLWPVKRRQQPGEIYEIRIPGSLGLWFDSLSHKGWAPILRCLFRSFSVRNQPPNLFPFLSSIFFHLFLVAPFSSVLLLLLRIRLYSPKSLV